MTSYYRCTTYVGRERCTYAAIAWLLDPDGQRNPGGAICWDHGCAVLGEFAVKLGEQWGAVSLVEEESR